MKAHTISDIEQTRKAREDRLARIKQIQALEETNTGNSTHIAALGITATGVAATKDIFDTIADIFKVESPTSDPILPFLKFSYWQSFFLQWVSPAALIFGWKHTYDSAKRLFNAENRNWVRYVDLAVSFATSLAGTLLFCLGGSKIGLLLALGMFAGNAVYGLVNTVKYIGYAIFAKTSEERKQCLIQAGKQFISIFTNTLAFAANFFIGIKLPEGEVVSECFKLANNLLTGLSISAIAGIAANSAENTLKTIKNLWIKPRETVRELWHEFRAHPIKSIVMLPIRIITLPVQVVLYGAYKAVKSLFDWKRPIKDAEEPAQAKPSQTTREIKSKLAEKKAGLVSRIKAQLAEYQTKYPTESERERAPSRDRAKWQFLEDLLYKKLKDNAEAPAENVAIETLETDARKISSDLYTSFFKRVSRTKEIVEAVRELDYGFRK
ncbi:MAG: hypothetical protein ACYCQI_06675 [Gammaproteobacteria bacterium]